MMIFSVTEKLLFAASVLLFSLGIFILGLENDPYLSLGAMLVVLGVFLPMLSLIGLSNLSKGLRKVKKIKVLQKYKLEIAGFLVSTGMSLTLYFMTVAPSASLWDCSEFIAAVYKLQVPHPPGAPLFLLVANIFSLFSFGNVEDVALMINYVSVVASALAIGTLFGILCLLTKNYFCRFSSVLGSCLGALLISGIDTFWYSAVEAETYASAAFFTLLIVFYALIVKSRQVHFQPRFLVLLAYLLALGYCVHPMCLLAIPVVTVIYQPFSQKWSVKTGVASFITGLGVLLLCSRVLTEGMFKAIFQLDLALVNNFHMPFFSGLAVFVWLVTILGIVVWKFWRKALIVYWCVLFFVLGLSPYVVLFVRSATNPAMDQHDPENLLTIASYMARESYGSRPLLYGPYFDAQAISVSVKGGKYLKGEKMYMPNGADVEYDYEASRMTLFPRMYSSDHRHIKLYKKWSGLQENENPTFKHNLIFLFNYQLGHMYFRYLMWNFAGRHSDLSNSTWVLPWEIGLDFAGDFHQSKVFNQYWCIPLVLGLIGLWAQRKQDKKGFAIVTALLLMTGPVLSFYLNAPPSEPRERDYIYVVSFMAYGIWVAIGMIYLMDFLIHKVPRKVGWPMSLSMCAFIVFWVCLENYDDHDRSHQTLHLEHARAVLKSCKQDAILFTGGDNDTFPLWYLQQVEGFRTDVRVIVLSYFNSDWCLRQSKTRQLDSPPLPLKLSNHQLRANGPNDVLFLKGDAKIDVKKLIRLINTGDKRLRSPSRRGQYYHQIPGNQFLISGSKNIKTQPNIQPMFLDKIAIKAKGSQLYKSDLAFLDIVSHNNWRRPIYFNMTSLNGLNLHVKPHVVNQGFVHQLLPIDMEKPVTDYISTYSHLVENVPFRHPVQNNHYLHSEDHLFRVLDPIRKSYNELIDGLLKIGEMEKAHETMALALSMFYPEHLNPGFNGLNLARILLSIHKNEDAQRLLKQCVDVSKVLSTSPDARYRRYHQYILKEGNALLKQIQVD